MVIRMKIMKTIGMWAMALLLLFVTIGSALAIPSMPHQVYGEVTILGKVVPYHLVELTPCDYRLSTPDNCVEVESKCDEAPGLCRFETDSNGYYIFEMGNIYALWRPGDLVKIDVCDGHKNCEVIVILGDDRTQVDFSIGEVTQEQLDSGEVVDVIDDPVNKPDPVIVPLPDDDSKYDELMLMIAGVKTSIERLKTGYEQLPWWKGFWGIILYFAAFLGTGGGAYYLRGRRMAATLLKKHNDGKYGK